MPQQQQQQQQQQQIAVAFYHREHLSRGQNRQRLGYEAYHWGLIVMPMESDGRDCDMYDATDASEIDRVTWRMTNPTMEWFFRSKTNVDPERSTKLIGRIVIGNVPRETSASDIQELLGQVPLPAKNTHPQQSCVTWVLDAVRALQKNGWARGFEVDQFKDWALYYADKRHSKDGSREAIERYQEEGCLV